MDSATTDICPNDDLLQTLDTFFENPRLAWATVHAYQSDVLEPAAAVDDAANPRVAEDHCNARLKAITTDHADRRLRVALGPSTTRDPVRFGVASHLRLGLPLIPKQHLCGHPMGFVITTTCSIAVHSRSRSLTPATDTHATPPCLRGWCRRRGDGSRIGRVGRTRTAWEHNERHVSVLYGRRTLTPVL